MALKKEIRQDDGVVTSYHRILYVQSTINSHVSIAVLSYVDETSKDMENVGKTPYKKAVTYETTEVSDMSIKKAYAYLKTLPEFEGAEDILDDTDDNISGDDFLAMVEEVM